jgi:predicted Zn-dependent protease
LAIRGDQLKLPLWFVCIGVVGLAPSHALGQFSKPSARQQIKLGQEVAADIRLHEKILPVQDPRVVELRTVATRILGTIHDEESWAFTFDVIDSPIVNAFSLPGGPTFFYTGLLDKLKTEDELAGVLAHELTHVRLQHWATQFAASQRRDLLINLGLIFSRSNYEITHLAGMADDLAFNLPFSRSQESAADAGGEELVVQAGYNPNGMISVFEMFSKVLGSDDAPTFLSDHPSDHARIERLTKLIQDGKVALPPERPLAF